MSVYVSTLLLFSSTVYRVRSKIRINIGFHDSIKIISRGNSLILQYLVGHNKKMCKSDQLS